MRQSGSTRLVARFATIAVLFCLTLAAVPGLGLWHTAAAQQPPGTVVNVELILDSSGSMAQQLEGGQTRIDAAKQVLNQVIDQLPEREGINVGFRVYGHRGANTEAGRAESCRSTELRVPIEGVNKDALRAEVESYQPVGWTPIALSLRESANDFPPAAENVVNAVVLVTDGLETCGGDPCSASRFLKTGASAVTTHVIGFALAEEEQENLQCIVDESGGLLLGAGSADELSAALFQVLEELEVVVLNGLLEIEEIGGVYPRATVEGIAEATDSNPTGDPFAAEFAESNVLELPAGRYLVRWANPSGQESSVQVEVLANETTVIRGSILRFPHGSGQAYRLTDVAGVVIWQAPVQTFDQVWVLPGVYRLQLDGEIGDAVLLAMTVQTLPGSVTQIDVTVAS